MRYFQVMGQSTHKAPQLLLISKTFYHSLDSKKKSSGSRDASVCMYVCMGITYSKSMDQPVKVANPARGKLNREN